MATLDQDSGLTIFERHKRWQRGQFEALAASRLRKSSSTRRCELTSRTQKPKVKGHADLPEPPSPHVADEEMQKHRVSRSSSSKGFINHPKGDHPADDANKFLLYKISSSEEIFHRSHVEGDKAFEDSYVMQLLRQQKDREEKDALIRQRQQMEVKRKKQERKAAMEEKNRLLQKQKNRYMEPLEKGRRRTASNGTPRQQRKGRYKSRVFKPLLGRYEDKGKEFPAVAGANTSGGTIHANLDKNKSFSSARKIMATHPKLPRDSAPKRKLVKTIPFHMCQSQPTLDSPSWVRVREQQVETPKETTHKLNSKQPWVQRLKSVRRMHSKRRPNSSSLHRWNTSFVKQYLEDSAKSVAADGATGGPSRATDRPASASFIERSRKASYISRTPKTSRAARAEADPTSALNPEFRSRFHHGGYAVLKGIKLSRQQLAYTATRLANHGIELNQERFKHDLAADSRKISQALRKFRSSDYLSDILADEEKSDEEVYNIYFDHKDDGLISAISRVDRQRKSREQKQRAIKPKAYGKRKKQRASMESKKAERQTKEKGKNEFGSSKKAEISRSGGGGSADELKNAGEHASGGGGEGEEKVEGKGAVKHEDRRVISAPPTQPLPSRESLLRVLDLTDCSLEDSSLLYLKDKLRISSTLTRLNLSNNLITDAGIKMLLPSIRKRGILEELDISHNRVRQAAGEILGLTPLRAVNMSFNRLHIFEHSIAKRMASKLRHNKHLWTLDISNCRLNGVEMGLIAKGLKHNHTLIQIFVHGNQGPSHTDALGFLVQEDDTENMEHARLIGSETNWSTQPPILERYLDKVLYRDCWIAGGWREITVRLHVEEIAYRCQILGDLSHALNTTSNKIDLEKFPSNVALFKMCDLNIHLRCDQFKPFPLQYDSHYEGFVLARVMPPGPQSFFLSIRRVQSHEVRGSEGTCFVIRHHHRRKEHSLIPGVEIPDDHVNAHVLHGYTIDTDGQMGYSTRTVVFSECERTPQVEAQLYNGLPVNVIQVKRRCKDCLSVVRAPIRPTSIWKDPDSDEDDSDDYEWTLSKSVFARRPCFSLYKHQTGGLRFCNDWHQAGGLIFTERFLQLKKYEHKTFKPNFLLFPLHMGKMRNVVRKHHDFLEAVFTLYLVNSLTHHAIMDEKVTRFNFEATHRGNAAEAKKMSHYSRHLCFPVALPIEDLLEVFLQSAVLKESFSSPHRKYASPQVRRGAYKYLPKAFHDSYSHPAQEITSTLDLMNFDDVIDLLLKHHERRVESEVDYRPIFVPHIDRFVSGSEAWRMTKPESKKTIHKSLARKRSSAPLHRRRESKSSTDLDFNGEVLDVSKLSLRFPIAIFLTVQIAIRTLCQKKIEISKGPNVHSISGAFNLFVTTFLHPTVAKHPAWKFIFHADAFRCQCIYRPRCELILSEHQEHLHRIFKTYAAANQRYLEIVREEDSKSGVTDDMEEEFPRTQRRQPLEPLLSLGGWIQMILDSHCCEKDMPSQLLQKSQAYAPKRLARRGRNKVPRRKTTAPTNVIKQKASSVARKPILLCHICFLLCCGHTENASDQAEGLLTFPDFLEAVCHCARIIVQSTAPVKIAKVKNYLKTVKKKSVEDEFTEGLLFVLECLQSIDLDAVISASNTKEVHYLS